MFKLLGYPGSPHYQENPGRRLEQGRDITPEVGRELCNCLVQARQELMSALFGVFDYCWNFYSQKVGTAPACFDNSCKILDA